MNTINTSSYQAFLAQILGCEASDINETINYTNFPQWDSFAHVEIMIALQELFAIEFSEDNFSKYSNAIAIKALFDQKINVKVKNG
jgi:acyl carrier protein